MELYKSLTHKKNDLNDQLAETDMGIVRYTTELKLLDKELVIAAEKMYDDCSKNVLVPKEQYLCMIDNIFTLWTSSECIGDNTGRLLITDFTKGFYNTIVNYYVHGLWEVIKLDKHYSLNSATDWNEFIRFIMSQTEIPIDNIELDKEFNTFHGFVARGFDGMSTEERKGKNYLRYLYDLSNEYIKLKTMDAEPKP